MYPDYPFAIVIYSILENKRKVTNRRHDGGFKTENILHPTERNKDMAHFDLPIEAF
jgi:hypothetical protein